MGLGQSARRLPSSCSKAQLGEAPPFDTREVQLDAPVFAQLILEGVVHLGPFQKLGDGLQGWEADGVRGTDVKCRSCSRPCQGLANFGSGMIIRPSSSN